MSLSRKRKKELKRLRQNAEQLWGTQQEVLDHASSVAREASRQLGHLTREQVGPRVRQGYDAYLRPGVEGARSFARVAGKTVEHNVVPAVGNVLGTVMAVGDVARDARVRQAMERLSPKKLIEPPKEKTGFGTYLAVGAGVIAAAGVAYAVWQTFRADDELWVADEEPEGEKSPAL
jgi:hypothetical protein